MTRNAKLVAFMAIFFGATYATAYIISRRHYRYDESNIVFPVTMTGKALYAFFYPVAFVDSHISGNAVFCGKMRD
jgi:hypothetical protein